MKFRVLLSVVGLGLYGKVWAKVSVDWSGNETFRDSRINDAVPLPPEAPDESGLKEWIYDARMTLQDFYEDEGFFEVGIQGALERQEEDWQVRMQIREGPRYRVDSVAVVTADSLPAPVRPRKFSLEPDDHFRRELIMQDKRKVLQAFGDAGYLQTRVSERIDIDTAQASVGILYVVESFRISVFDTLIVRNRRERPLDSLRGLTRESLLRSLVPYERGDTVRFRINDQVTDKLRATGAFNFVRLKDSLLPEGETALVLQTMEDMPGRLRTSLFYDTQYKFGANADLSQRNFAGNLNEVRGGFTMALEKQSLNAGYGSALTFGYLLRFDNELEVNWFQTDPFHHVMKTPPFRGDFEGENTASLSRQVTTWLRLVASGELLARSRTLSLEQRQRGLALNIIPTAFFTFLDNPLDPIRGVRFALTLGNGGPLIRQERFRPFAFRHNWVEAQTAYYYPVFIRELILAARLDGGRFFGDADLNVPRFFLGGPRTIRSFAYKSLCPLRETVTVEGERISVCLEDGIVPAYALASLELRIQLFALASPLERMVPSLLRPLQTVPFVDVGKVWDTRRGFEGQPEGEGISYGLGFRYPLFGIFNVRMDFAFGRDGAGERNFNWILDLAHAF